MLIALAILIGLAVGAALGVLVIRAMTSRNGGPSLLAAARRDAEATRREAEIEARELAVSLRAKAEEEIRERRAQITRLEELLASKTEDTDRRGSELERLQQELRKQEETLEELRARELRELERISSMTVDEAKRRVLDRSEELVRHELERRVRQAEEEARNEAKRRARNLVADALQRVAASHAAETTVTVVELPTDDMKGRIIGKEGRNIRALEHLTGVDIIIDDTPNAVVLSSFDGIRREIARMTLAKLIEDGRIHPSRIEETYYQSKAEIEEQ